MEEGGVEFGNAIVGLATYVSSHFLEHGVA